MKQNNNIEKIFGESLRNSGAKPPDGMKEAISKKLFDAGYLGNTPKPKGYNYWIIGAIAFFAVMIPIVYFITKNNGIEKNPVAQTVQNAPEISNDKKLNLKENNSPIVNPKVNAEKEEIKKGNTANNTAFETPKIQKGNVKSDEILNNSNQNTGDNPTNNSITQSNTNNIKYEEINTNIEKPINNITPNKELKKNDQTEDKSNIVTKKNDSAVAISNNIDKIPTKEAAVYPRLNLNTDLLKKPVEHSPKDSTITIQKSKRRFIVDFALDLYAGPNFNTPSYSTTDASKQATVDDTKNSESDQTTFIYGLGINKHFGKFLIEAGINSVKLKSSFSHEITSTIYDTSASHKHYIDSSWVDSNNVTHIIHVDSNWVHSVDTVNKNSPYSTTNRIEIVEVPFLIGYIYNVGKFDITFKTGASISFINTVSAALISPYGNDIIVYNTSSNSPYRRSYWSYLAAINMAYNINDNFAVFLQPTMKVGLSSIYNSDYPISKKIQSYNIGAGLRIKFN